MTTCQVSCPRIESMEFLVIYILASLFYSTLVVVVHFLTSICSSLASSNIVNSRIYRLSDTYFPVCTQESKMCNAILDGANNYALCFHVVYANHMC